MRIIPKNKLEGDARIIDLMCGDVFFLAGNYYMKTNVLALSGNELSYIPCVNLKTGHVPSLPAHQLVAFSSNAEVHI